MQWSNLSITFLLCAIDFSTISGSIFRADLAQKMLTLFPSNIDRYQQKKFKTDPVTELKKFKPEMSLNEKLAIMIYRIVHRYLAARKQYYRSETAEQEQRRTTQEEVHKCEDECRKEVRIVCSIGTYTCTDFTVENLGHSCYLECHWHLTDPNPYREHLYHEKFRKAQKRTTTTELPHPSTRRTTEVYSSEYSG